MSTRHARAPKADGVEEAEAVRVEEAEAVEEEEEEDVEEREKEEEVIPVRGSKEKVEGAFFLSQIREVDYVYF